MNIATGLPYGAATFWNCVSFDEMGPERLVDMKEPKGSGLSTNELMNERMLLPVDSSRLPWFGSSSAVIVPLRLASVPEYRILIPPETSREATVLLVTTSADENINLDKFVFCKFVKEFNAVAAVPTEADVEQITDGTSLHVFGEYTMNPWPVVPKANVPRVNTFCFMLGVGKPYGTQAPSEVFSGSKIADAYIRAHSCTALC